MPRFFLVALLALGGLSPRAARGQDLPAPPLARNAELSTGERPLGRATLELAEEALAAGLSSTAAELYSQMLSDPRLSPADRERAGLGLTSAYLERARTAEARAALAFLPSSPRKALREGLLALLEDDVPSAKTLAADIDLGQIPAHEKAWVHALRWMIAAAEGDNLGVNTNLEAAGRTAVSEEQRQRIEILGYRAAVLAGRLGERTLSTLQELHAAAKDSPLAFAYARNLALALAHAKRPADAARVLTENRRLPADRLAEADLLAGLILGPQTPAGRERLREAARNPANPSVRVTALRALVFAAEELVKTNPAEAKAVGNEIHDFLVRRGDGQLSFLCPRDPKVLDAIHLARAQAMLIAGNREKARQAAEDLLREVPASPLAREAVRTLALTAWGDGAYRLAATHISTLAEGATGTPRDVLRTVAADCDFLAKDYALAEKAYAVIQTETSAPDMANAAFLQRVQCFLLMADNPSAWSRACVAIEEAAKARPALPRRSLWMATWNLIDDVRRANRPVEAEQLMKRLDAVTADAQFDFALRFDWLRALIALGNRHPEQAARLADGIARRLDKVPADAPAEFLNAVPELRGHVALLKARTSLVTGANPAGLEELAALRRKYGKVAAAAASYLVEGRHLAALGRHAEAQARFEALAKEFQGEPSLAEFAQLGLYEAAEQAALQVPASGEGKLRDAVELLERLTETYPQSALLVRVALRRAEILRSMGDFDKALLVLDGLIRDRPADPSRPQAEMARADALFGLAELRRDRNGLLDRQRTARAAAAYERVAEAWAKDSDEIRIEATYKWSLALLERAKTEDQQGALSSRREARNLLLRNLRHLRASADPASPLMRFGSDCRLWLARSILSLGEISAQDGDRAEAIAAYRLLVEVNRGLPAGEARLPGQATAESKLAALRSTPSNQALKPQ